MLAATTVPVDEVVPEGLPSVKSAAAWGLLPSIGRMQSPVVVKEYSCSSHRNFQWQARCGVAALSYTQHSVRDRAVCTARSL